MRINSRSVRVTSLRINEDFYIKHIGGRPVAGQSATLERNINPAIAIVKVDGLDPYGPHHDGRLSVVAGDYELA